MADKTLGLKKGGKGQGTMRRIVGGMLPEWQVFVRDHHGQARHFTISHRVQIICAVSTIGLAFWAGTCTTLLSQRPAQLAEKEMRLDQAMASTRATQARLANAERLVADIAREVGIVHANLQTLTESADLLDRDRAARGPGRNAARPGHGDGGEDGSPQTGTDEARLIGAKIHELEASLARLQATYDKAVQQVADTAGARISETENSLNRLGLDPERVLGGTSRNPGQGGPFIPLRAESDADGSMGSMIRKVQYWAGVRAALQRLPLAEPIHGGYDFNSGFGTRNDPLNNRTGIHEGIDLGAPQGTPIYATGDGVVAETGARARYGLTVDIDHGNGVSTRYAHLSRIKVQPGQKVSRATIIGLVGTTGRSTGPHLHYEVRLNSVPRDPLKFISAGRDVQKNR